MKKLEIDVCGFFDWNLNFLTYNEYLTEFFENEVCVNEDVINNGRFGYLDKSKQNTCIENIKKISKEIVEILFDEYITIPSLQKEVAYLILVTARIIAGFKEGENLKIRQRFKISLSNKQRFEASVNHILNEFNISRDESISSMGLQYQSTITQKTNETGNNCLKLYNTPKNTAFDSSEVQYMNVKPNKNDISITSEYELNLKPVSLKNAETAHSSQSVVRNLSKEKNYTPSNKSLKESLVLLEDQDLRSDELKTLVKKKEDSYGQTMRKEMSFNKEGNFMKKSNFSVLGENQTFEVPSPILREKVIRAENSTASYLSRNRYKNRQNFNYESKENYSKYSDKEELKMKKSVVENQAYVSLADEYKKLKQKSIQKNENQDNELSHPGKLSISGIEKITIDNRDRTDSVEMKSSKYYNPPKMRYSKRRRSPNTDVTPGWQTDRYANRSKRSPIYSNYTQEDRSYNRRENSVERQQPMTDRSGYYNKPYHQQNYQNQGYEYNPRISSSSYLPRDRDYSSRESKPREESLTQRSRRYSNMNENYYSPNSVMNEEPVMNHQKKVNVPLLKLSKSRLDSRRSIKRSPVMYNRVQTSRERRTSGIGMDRSYMGRDYPRAPMTDRNQLRSGGDYMKIEGIDEHKDNSYFRRKSHVQREYYSPSTYNYRSREKYDYRKYDKMRNDVDMRYSNFMGSREKRRRADQISPSPIERERMMRKSYGREENSNRYIYRDRNGSVTNRSERSPLPRDFEKVYTPGYSKTDYGEKHGRYKDYETKENYGDNYNYYW